TGAANHTHPPGTAPHDHSAGAAARSGTGGAAAIGGLSLSAEGYTLAPVSTTWTAGQSQALRYRILGPDNQPVTSFAVVHERPMHLVVVRRDLSGYRHLHPVMAADGTWTVPLRLPAPGVWRAYADFAVAADGRRSAMTLGTDLVVAGDYRPRPLPAPAREAGADGLTVAYEGTPQIGATQPLLFRVYRGGSPVPDLQPYLGAYGHLVALRDGDLGYLHVHPEPQLAGGAVKFWLAAPGPGRYRLFFDVQVGGAVHTAEFTVSVP
ncbi:MAG TPA: hypothetical protein VF462_10760, partial [Micromonosporaceae bacterium]